MWPRVISRSRTAFDRVVFALWLIGVVCVAQAIGSDTKQDLQASVTDSRRNAIVNAVEKASPSVVNISTTRIQEVRVNPFDDFWAPFFSWEVPTYRRELRGLGSGVIVDRRGYVLTNQHVINDANTTKIILPDGREFEAKVIAEDALSDLALLQIDATDLPQIEIGDSEHLLIGEWAIAIGHPFAAAVKDLTRPTVTIGVVSAVERTLKTEERLYRHLIQTDASINPGNSGGALVNLHGQLIGINTVIYSTSGGSQGIGFAIPVNIAMRVVERLSEHGAVVPPYIGITPQSLTRELVEHLKLDSQLGVLVAGVEEGSPAALADIRRSDVIEAIDGEPVSSLEIYWAITRLLNQNQTVNFRLVRDGKHREVRLKILKLEWEYVVPGWGITVEQPDLKTAQNYQQRGVVVTKVDRKSALAGGLKRGDLIYRLNNLSIGSLEEFKRTVSSLRRGFEITLYFERDGRLMRFRNLIIQ